MQLVKAFLTPVVRAFGRNTLAASKHFSQRCRRTFSSAPSAETNNDGSRKYMYAFGGLLVGANVFTVWQEVDAHDEEALALKLERQRAWEEEQAQLAREKAS